MDYPYELVVVIINRGFSDLVMDNVRAVGATGGTILNARGTAVKSVKNLFGITVNPDKELILILTKKDVKEEIMSTVCKSAGLGTKGRGIVFSVPVDNVLGITLGINEEKPEDDKK